MGKRITIYFDDSVKQSERFKIEQAFRKIGWLTGSIENSDSCFSKTTTLVDAAWTYNREPVYPDLPSGCHIRQS